LSIYSFASVDSVGGRARSSRYVFTRTSSARDVTREIRGSDVDGSNKNRRVETRDDLRATSATPRQFPRLRGGLSATRIFDRRRFCTIRCRSINYDSSPLFFLIVVIRRVRRYSRSDRNGFFGIPLLRVIHENDRVSYKYIYIRVLFTSFRFIYFPPPDSLSTKIPHSRTLDNVEIERFGAY